MRVVICDAPMYDRRFAGPKGTGAFRDTFYIECVPSQANVLNGGCSQDGILLGSTEKNVDLTMRTRPRTKFYHILHNRRCPKCGAKLNTQRTRCKRCAQVVPRPKKPK